MADLSRRRVPSSKSSIWTALACALLLTLGFPGCGGKTAQAPPAPPAITAQPQSQTVTAGQKATFGVSATMATGYQWRKNGNEVAGATTALLDIADTTPAMNGDRFTIAISGPGGSLTSSEAVLTVQHYSITAHPQDTSVVDGGSATFSAQAVGHPTTAACQWQQAAAGSDAFTDLAGQTGETLALPGLSYAVDHGIKLRRKDVHATGTYFTNSATLTLAALAPTITVEPLDRAVQVAQNTVFTLDYAGTVGTVQWFRKPAGGAAAPIPGATAKSLACTPASMGENGDVYYAVVTNPQGSATTRQALLTVSPVPVAPHFTLHPQDQTGHLNQTVTFTAAASGVPEPTYRWKRNNVELPAQTGASLSVLVASLTQDGDRYVCLANNGVGGDVASSQALLHALPAPVAPWFTTQAAHQEVTLGSNATFTWTAQGSPTPTEVVQENLGGSWATIGTGFSLTLANVQLSDAGRQFRCLASNSEGSTSSNAATLTVNPVIHTLSVSLGAGVTGTPATTGWYPQGTSVAYAYAASPGYENLVVLVDGASAPASGTLTMGAAHAITASATQVQHTLTYTAGVHGSISGNASQMVAPGGHGSAVTAVPDAHYHFTGWSDGVATNPRTDTNVHADLAVTAAFAIDTYSLTYTAGTGGSLLGTTSQTIAYGGDGAAVTALPNPGCRFVDWSDGSTANPRTDTNLQANRAVTANFASNTFALTYLAGANGTLSGSASQTVNVGASGTAVKAVGDPGYGFASWSDGSTLNPRTDLNVQADLTVTATFAANPNAVKYVTQGGAGAKDGSTWANALGEAEFIAALVAAPTGTEFWLAAGSYRPSTTTDATKTFTLKNGVGIYGGFAGTETARDQRDWTAHVSVFTGDLENNDANKVNGVTTSFADIVGTNTHRVVTATTLNATAVLDGVTVSAATNLMMAGAGMWLLQSSLALSNCAFVGNDTITNGGGLCTSSSNLTLTACVFSGNRARGTNGGGGGLYVSGGSLRLVNCTFENNVGNAGGGLYTSSPVTMTGCIFRNNVGSTGGGMFAIGNTLIADACTFTGNSATTAGGLCVSITTTTLTHCQVTHNSAFTAGGLWADSTTTLTHCQVANNSATALGGGIHHDGTSLTLVGCTLSGNTAGGEGGGLHMPSGGPGLTNCTLSGNRGDRGSAIYAGGSVNLLHCTVTANTSTNPTASVVQINGTYTLTARNSIFWNPGIWEFTGGLFPNVTYSLIEGSFAGTGNLQADPLLGPLANNGGLTPTHALSPGSPAVDAGLAAGAPATDQRGEARPKGAGVDMGAYEL